MTKAETTRINILQKSFALIYANGYQATSIDQIIATTDLTKGAFFYHFKNKDEMGIAMIKEVMKPGMYRSWIAPLLVSSDPVVSIYEMMEEVLLRNKFFDVRYGCPAMNLAEEMAPVNTMFRTALKELMRQWQEALAVSISKAKKNKILSSGVNSAQVAVFVTAGYAGARIMGKMYGKEAYTSFLKQLNHYLEALR